MAQAQARGKPNPFSVKVLSNSVVIRCLEKYLSYDDLKACRLVSQAFNSSILETSFLNRTKLIVKEDTVRSGILSHLSFNPRSVDLYLIEPKTEDNNTRGERPKLTEKEFEPLYHCFEDVQSLKLYYDDTNPRFCKKVLPDVIRLMRATKSLKELQLSSWDVGEYLSRKVPKDVIEKLKDVVSLEIIPRWGVYCYDVHQEGFKEINKLQRVKIRDGFSEAQLWYEDAVTPGNVSALVVRNADTITSLKILEPYLWTNVSDENTKYICDTQFPKLQELRIRAKNDQTVEISSFLAAHGKQLTSLGIRILGEFPCDIIDGVLQEASKKLKKLNIATNTFDQSRSRNLAFLEDCHELESFKLRFLFSRYYDSNCDSMAEVFSYLPTKKLRKLALTSLPTPVNESLNLVKIQALRGLTYLALDYCEEAVNDDTINAIFKYLTQLEYLRIKQASECGVKGFTGTGNIEDPTPEPGKVAASNLIRLKQLILQDCGLDDHIVKVALKFKDLEILDIRVNISVTKVSCEIAVSQNPALRVLRADAGLRFAEVIHLKSFNARLKTYESQVANDVDHDEEDELQSDNSDSSEIDMEEWMEEEPADVEDDHFDEDAEDYDFNVPEYEHEFMDEDEADDEEEDEPDVFGYQD